MPTETLIIVSVSNRSLQTTVDDNDSEEETGDWSRKRSRDFEANAEVKKAAGHTRAADDGSDEKTGELICKRRAIFEAKEVDAKKAVVRTAADDDDSREKIGKLVYKCSVTFKAREAEVKKRASLTAKHVRTTNHNRTPNNRCQDVPVPKKAVP